MKRRIAVFIAIMFLVFASCATAKRATIPINVEYAIKEMAAQTKTKLPIIKNNVIWYDINYANGVLIYKYSYTRNVSKFDFDYSKNYGNVSEFNNLICASSFGEYFINAGGIVKQIYYNQNGGYLFDIIVDSCP